jgi:hypothetical protein
VPQTPTPQIDLRVAEIEASRTENQINLEHYNGTPWTGPNAVTFDGPIRAVDDRLGILLAITKQKVSDFSETITVIAMFEGVLGERTLHNVGIIDPDGKIFEKFFFEEIQVIDVMAVIPVNGINHRIVFSLPAGEMGYYDSTYTRHPDIVSTREVLNNLRLGRTLLLQFQDYGGTSKLVQILPSLDVSLAKYSSSPIKELEDEVRMMIASVELANSCPVLLDNLAQAGSRQIIYCGMEPFLMVEAEK